VNNWLVALVTLGEGYHNYHHSFPMDYRTSEFPLPGLNINFMANFIEFAAWLGLAYDLKFPSDKLVQKRIFLSGDGSHPHHDNN
jgi:stearoyl-CoA desaturase (delta-9 desaturase)